jgi:hypothetical protein
MNFTIVNRWISLVQKPATFLGISPCSLSLRERVRVRGCTAWRTALKPLTPALSLRERGLSAPRIMPKEVL